MIQKKLKIIIFVIFILTCYKLISLQSHYNIVETRLFSSDSADFRINPRHEICGHANEKKITLLSLVIVRVDSFEHRSLMRSTWASKLLFPRMQVVFVLGYSANSTVNKMVKDESVIYGDIVQGEFLDSYR